MLHTAAQIDYTGALLSGVPITPSNVSSLLQTSYRDANRFLQDMRKLGCLVDVPGGTPRISADRFYRGELRDPPPGYFYTRLYVTGINALYQEQAFRYLHLMIPYLHRTMNVLCEDPLETA